jgi:hypothetical protein
MPYVRMERKSLKVLIWISHQAPGARCARNNSVCQGELCGVWEYIDLTLPHHTWGSHRVLVRFKNNFESSSFSLYIAHRHMFNSTCKITFLKVYTSFWITLYNFTEMSAPLSSVSNIKWFSFINFFQRTSCRLFWRRESNLLSPTQRNGQDKVFKFSVTFLETPWKVNVASSFRVSQPCLSCFAPRLLWLLADESGLSRNCAEAAGLPPATPKH